MTRYEAILHVYSSTQSIRKTAITIGVSEQVVRRCIITAGLYSTDITDEISRMRNGGLSVSDIMQRTGLCYSAVLANMPYERNKNAVDHPTAFRLFTNTSQVVLRFLQGLFDGDKSTLRYVISSGCQFRSSYRINQGNISRPLSPFLPLQVPLVASLGRMSNFPCFSPTK